jgi:hypothetical protein
VTADRVEPVLIPKDPEARKRLARMAGLTEDEEAALNQWCYDQQRERDAATRRGLEQHGNDVMS